MLGAATGNGSSKAILVLSSRQIKAARVAVAGSDPPPAGGANRIDLGCGRERLLEKAIPLPSGDQVGSRPLIRWIVRICWRLRRSL